MEDVFKRTRLAVRRRSNGLQIPWESTSLEEDYWFHPPKELKKLADAEIERDFKQELAVWEKIQNATQPSPFEDYLRRYPSGRFSELAQLQLDRVLARLGEKKVDVVAAPENPYTKGTVSANTAYKLRDRYTYRVFDTRFRVEQKPFTNTVTDITENEVIFNDGVIVTDLLRNFRKDSEGRQYAATQTVPTEFVVGKRWNTRFRHVDRSGRDGVVDLELRVADRENITVPAGTFNAFRIEARGWRSSSGPNTSWNWKRWFAPDQVRSVVAEEWFVQTTRLDTVRSERLELAEFSQS